MSQPLVPARKKPSDARPFRQAVFSGLGVFLPPLLTIVIILWTWNTIAVYLLNPVESWARWAAVKLVWDVREDLPIANERDQTAVVDGQVYKQVDADKFVPLEVYKTVQQHRGAEPMPSTAQEIYNRYVDITYLRRLYVIPVFLFVFVGVLYTLGKFLAAGVGKFFWSRFEFLVHRLPLVREVYSSVKQVTDFMLTERELEYTRVVAVEYPRKGIWSLAMVTSEGFRDISAVANEPIVSLLIPTSPMPFTGFTVLAKRSDVIDLNITMDQAIQYIVSCGVVVPPQQLREFGSASAAVAVGALVGPAENGAHASGRAIRTGSE